WPAEGAIILVFFSGRGASCENNFAALRDMVPGGASGAGIGNRHPARRAKTRRATSGSLPAVPNTQTGGSHALSQRPGARGGGARGRAGGGRDGGQAARQVGRAPRGPDLAADARLRRHERRGGELPPLRPDVLGQELQLDRAVAVLVLLALALDRLQ